MNPFWTQAQKNRDWELFRNSALAQRSIEIADLDTALLQEAFLHSANQVRQKHHLEPLIYSEPLARVAQLYSEEQANLNFFGHHHPEKKEWKTPYDRITELVGPMNYTGENLAEYAPFVLKRRQDFYIIEELPDGQLRLLDRNKEPLQVHTYWSFAAFITDEWMHSTGHRMNILQRNFEEVGMGFALNKQQKPGELPLIIITQNFGTQ